MSSLKAFGRDALAQLLLNAGLSAPERACRGKLLILTFHRVLPEELRAQYPMKGLAVTPQELRWILSSVLARFELHTVSDAVRKLKRGRSGGTALIAVSFDDGQWDNLEFAAPVLQELGVRATFYLPSDFIGRSELLWHDRAAFAWQACTPATRRAVLSVSLQDMGLTDDASEHAFLEALKSIDPEARELTVSRLREASGRDAPEWARLMTWEEVAKLQQMGHEIGSHSCSHALLPQLDADSQRKELELSMRAIEAALGTPVRSMCYPNGSYDQRSAELAAEVGYENAVTTKWGINDPTRSVFELRRCDMDAYRLLDRRGSLSRARLAMRLSGWQPGLAE